MVRVADFLNRTSVLWYWITNTSRSSIAARPFRSLEVENLNINVVH